VANEGRQGSHPERVRRLPMMELMSRTDDCVRVECLGCGAHTRLEPQEYTEFVEDQRSVWCSTCGNFHRLTERREPARGQLVAAV
jgi:RNase P subunit RPR2